MTLLATRIAGLGTENAFKLGDDIANVVAHGMDIVRLNLGEPDFDSAPHINNEAIAQIRAGNSHYTDPQGIRPLREAIARHVASTRGIPVDAAQVVVTPGGKPPIGYTMQSYVNPGDEVIYPSPGFPIMNPGSPTSARNRSPSRSVRKRDSPLRQMTLRNASPHEPRRSSSALRPTPPVVS